MAERRMFAKTIIDSDAFLDMPLSTQSLYFHLSMRADDEGFINNPKKIQRMIGASDDDLKLLMLKSFLIPFDSGIVVIKHWRIHNYIQKDRFKETLYQEEKAMLSLKDNNAYTLAEKTLDTSCIHDGYITDTQDSIGKVSIVEDSIGKVSIDEKSAPKKPAKEKYGELGNVKLTIDEYDKLVNDYGYDLTQKAIKFLDEYIADKGYKSKSNYMAMKRWVFDAVKEQEAKKAKSAPKASTFDDAMQRFLAKGDN